MNPNISFPYTFIRKNVILTNLYYLVNVIFLQLLLNNVNMAFRKKLTTRLND